MSEGFETIEAFRPRTRIGTLLLRERLPGKIGLDLACGAVLAARAPSPRAARHHLNDSMVRMHPMLVHQLGGRRSSQSHLLTAPR
jgi:hypothetical protein